jgi:carboxyl-terminal processing protease
MSPVRTISIALTCALAAGALGLWFGGHPEHLPKPLRNAFVDDDRALRAEVIKSIESNYFHKVSDAKLKEASLKGIVDSLHDPFSHYLTPKEAGQLEQRISGQFEGVGMTVGQDKRGLRVQNVFDGSPARKAGITQGDVITAVDGKSIAGVSSEVATGQIKGPSGTKVTLRVLEPGRKSPRSVTVTRKAIEVPVSRGRVVRRGGRKLGVVQLVTFSSGAHGLVRKQIEKVRREGADALVLDLRGNGGGLLEEAVLVASNFVDNGKIVSVRGRARPERSESAQGNAIAPKLPLVVLVDRGSASASEIVTGALRDRGRATVVGTRTFGKGLVQEVQPLSNGGVLDITVARYYLPKGETISRKGIQPQVKAQDNLKTKPDEALNKALDTLLQKSR